MNNSNQKTSIKRIGYTFSLLSIGYLLGISGSLIPQTSRAQPAVTVDDKDEVKVEIKLSNEAIKGIQSAHESLTQAMETLKLEGLYTPATEGVNSYLVLTGGGNAIEDLKQGTGVDPVTFAALYAGMATEEINDDLSWDESGRLMYKNKLIRIYSVEELKARQVTLDNLLARKVGE